MIIVEQDIVEYTEININTRYANWDAGTTYDFSQSEVPPDTNTVFYEHYYYRSVVDGNIGNVPTDNPDLWLRWAVSNRYAQIDLRATTRTVWDATTATVPADNALITRFPNTGFNALVFGNVIGDSIKVQLFDNNDVLQFTQEEVIYNRPTSNNWYNYYFEEFVGGVEQAFFFRLPPVTGYIIVTIGASNGHASVGYMVAGDEIYVGKSLFGASLGLEDNSIVEVDDFGITKITKRIANSFMDIDVYFPSSQIKQMERKAASVFGKVVVFIGDEGDNSRYEHLATLGYIEGYTAVLSLYENTQASYSIREVI